MRWMKRLKHLKLMSQHAAEVGAERIAKKEKEEEEIIKREHEKLLLLKAQEAEAARRMQWQEEQMKIENMHKQWLAELEFDDEPTICEASKQSKNRKIPDKCIQSKPQGETISLNDFISKYNIDMGDEKVKQHNIQRVVDEQDDVVSEMSSRRSSHVKEDERAHTDEEFDTEEPTSKKNLHITYLEEEDYIVNKDGYCERARSPPPRDDDDLDLTLFSRSRGRGVKKRLRRLNKKLQVVRPAATDWRGDTSETSGANDASPTRCRKTHSKRSLTLHDHKQTTISSKSDAPQMMLELTERILAQQKPEKSKKIIRKKKTFTEANQDRIRRHWEERECLAKDSAWNKEDMRDYISERREFLLAAMHSSCKEDFSPEPIQLQTSSKAPSKDEESSYEHLQPLRNVSKGGDSIHPTDFSLSYDAQLDAFMKKLDERKRTRRMKQKATLDSNNYNYEFEGCDTDNRHVDAHQVGNDRFDFDYDEAYESPNATSSPVVVINADNVQPWSISNKHRMRPVTNIQSSSARAPVYKYARTSRVNNNCVNIALSQQSNTKPEVLNEPLKGRANHRPKSASYATRSKRF